MPDHVHLMWIGLRESSDQMLASAFLRKYFGRQMKPRWQQQAHDHVVRKDERNSGRYVDAINYILKNPVRSGEVERWEDYPYLGAMLAGYPDLHRRSAGFHERFWNLVRKESD